MRRPVAWTKAPPLLENSPNQKEVETRTGVEVLGTADVMLSS
jgi:hypothetical protein